LRYWVRNHDRELACLLWTSPAWKIRLSAGFRENIQISMIQ
jgi:hypothetical protein